MAWVWLLFWHACEQPGWLDSQYPDLSVGEQAALAYQFQYTAPGYLGTVWHLYGKYRLCHGSESRCRTLVSPAYYCAARPASRIACPLPRGRNRYPPDQPRAYISQPVSMAADACWHSSHCQAQSEFAC